MKIQRAIFVTLVGMSQWVVSGETQMDAIEKIKANSFEQREEGIAAITQQRVETVRSLIGVLEGSFPAESRRAAAKLLGEYRATNAVDALVKNLDLDVQGRVLKTLYKEDDIRAVSYALRSIGKPAIPAVLAKITQTDNSAVIKRCVRICLDIEGHDAAAIMVQQYSEMQTAAEAKQRLKQAIDVMEKEK